MSKKHRNLVSIKACDNFKHIHLIAHPKFDAHHEQEKGAKMFLAYRI